MMDQTAERRFPLSRLREFATLLGWNGLQLYLFHIEEYGTIPCYMTPDEKFNLQINENPIGQTSLTTPLLKRNDMA